jgi:hypothetical protein
MRTFCNQKGSSGWVSNIIVLIIIVTSISFCNDEESKKTEIEIGKTEKVETIKEDLKKIADDMITIVIDTAEESKKALEIKDSTKEEEKQPEDKPKEKEVIISVEKEEDIPSLESNENNDLKPRRLTKPKTEEMKKL